MSTFLWILVILVAFVVAARVRSLIAPRAFPPWMTPILEFPWRNRERILDRAGVTASERVLEIGPGAGWITQGSVQRLGDAGRHVCLDIQIAMLRKVRARLGEAAALVCASGSLLPFHDGAFDRALLVAVLGEIPDKPGALAELQRVIRPGGELAVEEVLPDPDYIRLPILRRMAAQAAFKPAQRLGNLADYTQRFARP